MTKEQKAMLTRIQKYAEEVIGETDPQKVRVSEQLERLKPVMEEIAKEQNRDITDIFIEYMDLASEFSVKQSEQMKEWLEN